MSIKIDGLDKLMQKLGDLDMLAEALYRPMTESMALLQDELAKAPRKAPGAFSRFATPAQRRAYWARVRSGDISHREGVGYVRTNTITRKWTFQVKRSSNGIIGELGNNADGAIWVQSAKHQQSFHEASGWVTDEQAIDKNRDEIQAKFRTAVRRELAK